MFLLCACGSAESNSNSERATKIQSGLVGRTFSYNKTENHGYNSANQPGYRIISDFKYTFDESTCFHDWYVETEHNAASKTHGNMSGNKEYLDYSVQISRDGKIILKIGDNKFDLNCDSSDYPISFTDGDYTYR